MLVNLISQYLTVHKRLVVPQLGAFIVKDADHSVLFSELLRRDDGVLRQLLREQGLADLAAAGEIDRFVFEVRHAVGEGRNFPLKGFGEMMPGPNGTIAFRHDPGIGSEPVREDAVGDAAGEPGAEQQAVGDSRPAASRRSRPLQPDKVAEAVRSAFGEVKVSPSAKMSPDPSLRGLRYGKPPKTTDAYTYVDRPPRRRADRFLWIAIIAATLAVAAIAFGYFREAQERHAEEEFLQQIAAPAAPSAADESDAQAAGQPVEQPAAQTPDRP